MHPAVVGSSALYKSVRFGWFLVLFKYSIFLLIFYLVLSITESEILKSLLFSNYFFSTLSIPIFLKDDFDYTEFHLGQ